MGNASLTQINEVSVMRARTQRHILAVGQLVYITNVQKSNAPIIPLGTIAEVNLPRLRGFGLLCRSQLRDDELKLMGGLSAKLLAEPSKYWSERTRKVFEGMKEDESLRGHLIEILSGDGANSIAVINSVEQNISLNWLNKEYSQIKSEVSKWMQDTTDSEMVALKKACGYEPIEDTYTMEMAA